MSSSSSSDLHHHRHKKKHRLRHHSNDSSSVLRSIRDDLQSILNRVAQIEGLANPINSESTKSTATPVVQRAERSTRPNQEQSFLTFTINHPLEEQSTSNVERDTRSGMQSTGSGAAWEDRDDLPDYEEQSIGGNQTQIRKIWTRRSKISLPLPPESSRRHFLILFRMRDGGT